MRARLMARCMHICVLFAGQLCGCRRDCRPGQVDARSQGHGEWRHEPMRALRQLANFDPARRSQQHQASASRAGLAVRCSIYCWLIPGLDQHSLLQMQRFRMEQPACIMHGFAWCCEVLVTLLVIHKQDPIVSTRFALRRRWHLHPQKACVARSLSAEALLLSAARVTAAG